MLFEIHKEGKIAYKRLSDADIKRSETSHQTHIGLSNDSLTFMADDKTEYSAMLIFKGFCDILSCEIAKIQRANGRREAPKISMGSKPNNVVNKIRSFANESLNKDFYLVWFGLDSLTPVFWLIEEDSIDYNLLNVYCDFSNLKDKKIVILERDNLIFSNVLLHIQSKIESVTLKLQKDLEMSVETENDNPKFKDVDVKKARKYINEIGKQGESLIDEYLNKQKSEKLIVNYEWMNKSGEQGKPFDFYIKYPNGLEQWIDVKSTEHEFEQAVIISKNEIKFITETEAPKYAIFRVYYLKDLQAKLKVCSECLKYVKKLYRDMDYMTQSMSDYKAAMINYKIAFEPGPISFNSISDEINVFFDAYQEHKQNPQNIPTSEKTIPLYDEYHEGCIPLYSLSAACGAFDKNEDSYYNEDPEIKGWVDVSGHGFTPNKDRYFAVHAKGDSMEPRIKDGDICIFEWYNNGSGGTRDGKIVLVYAKDYNFGDDWEFTIKEYHSEKIQDEDGWQHNRIVLKPLNTKYKAFEVTEDQQTRTIGVLRCIL